MSEMKQLEIILQGWAQISSMKFFKRRYIQLNKRFILCHLLALSWMIFSVFISIPWLHELAKTISMVGALFVIIGIAYIPGYINAFNVISLALERQPAFKTVRKINDISVLIACRNEEQNIRTTLTYIKNQDYEGKIKVYVIDNASTDHTYDEAVQAGKDLNVDVITVKENKPGKNNALNKALSLVDTDYIITLDADTLLHKSAIRYLIMRMQSAPDQVCAVAGSVLVRNSRQNFLAKLQEWDYFLGIASIKRLQGLYEGTLVAQGAFSLYNTQMIKNIGGWPDCIGEDIVLTWNILVEGKKVIYEPNAIAFTEVPIKLKHLYRQRSRWARGMIEALKVVKPWQQPNQYVKYLTTINLIMPYLDIVYTLCFIPGVIAALFGNYMIVGPLTLLVIPLAIIQNYILYVYQKSVFEALGLRVRKNIWGLIVYVLTYQIIMSPISLMGYIQEVTGLKRIWK